MRYETATLEDLKVILIDSVVMYKGEPVYIHAVNETAKGFKLSLTLLTDRDVFKVSLNSRYLSFLPVKLGYCNTPTGAVFVQRKPARAYKQGLSNHNINTLCIPDEMNWVANTGIYTEVMRKCILGMYPSREEAIKQVIIDKHSVAFSRTSCITVQGEVLYRGEAIGYVNTVDNSICFKWGKEAYKRILK